MLAFLDFISSKPFVCAVVVAVLILSFWGIWLSDRERVRRLVHEHLRTHRDMSDGEFVRETGINAAESTGAIHVRCAIAEAMGVPPLTVHPLEKLEYIAQFGFDGMDFIEIEMYIEKKLGKRFPRGLDQYAPDFKQLDVATIVRFLSEKGMFAPEKSRV